MGKSKFDLNGHYYVVESGFGGETTNTLNGEVIVVELPVGIQVKYVGNSEKGCYLFEYPDTLNTTRLLTVCPNVSDNLKDHRPSLFDILVFKLFMFLRNLLL